MDLIDECYYYLSNHAHWVDSPWHEARRNAIVWLWCWNHLPIHARRCIPRDIALLIAKRVRDSPEIVPNQSTILDTRGRTWTLQLNFTWKTTGGYSPAAACAQCSLPLYRAKEQWDRSSPTLMCMRHGSWTAAARQGCQFHPVHIPLEHSQPVIPAHSKLHACVQCLRADYLSAREGTFDSFLSYLTYLEKEFRPEPPEYHPTKHELRWAKRMRIDRLKDQMRILYPPQAKSVKKNKHE